VVVCGLATPAAGLNLRFAGRGRTPARRFTSQCRASVVGLSSRDARCAPVHISVPGLFVEVAALVVVHGFVLGQQLVLGVAPQVEFESKVQGRFIIL